MNLVSTKVHILSEGPDIRRPHDLIPYIIPHVEDKHIRLIPDETYCTGSVLDSEIHLLMFKGERRDYFVRASSSPTSGQVHLLEIC